MRRFLWERILSVSLFKTPFNISFCGTLCHVVTLIIKLFALGDRKLQFYPAILEVKLQWYEAVALYLRQGVELAYLALVQQQLGL